MKLLTAVGPERMKFTQIDQELYESFRETVPDYNFGTLLRLNPNDDYSEKNTCFALRVQFLAIEIARNKEGSNKAIYEKAAAAALAAKQRMG